MKHSILEVGDVWLVKGGSHLLIYDLDGAEEFKPGGFAPVSCVLEKWSSPRVLNGLDALLVRGDNRNESFWEIVEKRVCRGSESRYVPIEGASRAEHAQRWLGVVLDVVGSRVYQRLLARIEMNVRTFLQHTDEEVKRDVLVRILAYKTALEDLRELSLR
jgi:hypothetical protein